MPPQYRVGLNDPQRRAPLPPRAGEQDPEEPIPWTERQARPRARQHGQLLPKGQVLKGNRSVSAAHQTDRSENYDQRRQHTVSCRVFSDRINRGAGRSGCGEAQAFQPSPGEHVHSPSPVRHSKRLLSPRTPLNSPSLASSPQVHALSTPAPREESAFHSTHTIDKGGNRQRCRCANLRGGAAAWTEPSGPLDVDYVKGLEYPL